MDIKRFESAGVSKDSGHIYLKQSTEEARLTKEMREEGFIPVLDITPMLDIDYDQKREQFNYTITIYGVESEEPWRWEGWLNGNTIPMLHSTSRRYSANWG